MHIFRSKDWRICKFFELELKLPRQLDTRMREILFNRIGTGLEFKKFLVPKGCTKNSCEKIKFFTEEILLGKKKLASLF